MNSLTRKELTAEISRILGMMITHPLDPDVWPNSMTTPVPLSVLTTRGLRGHATKVRSAGGKVIIEVTTSADSPDDNLPYLSLTTLKHELEEVAGEEGEEGEEVIIDCAGEQMSASKIIGIGARDGYMAFLVTIPMTNTPEQTEQTEQTKQEGDTESIEDYVRGKCPAAASGTLCSECSCSSECETMKEANKKLITN